MPPPVKLKHCPPHLMRKEAMPILLAHLVVLVLLSACGDSAPATSKLSGHAPKQVPSSTRSISPTPSVIANQPGADSTTSAALPSYTPVTGISGNLSSEGSDTLAGLMAFWAEGFRYYYPNLNIQVQAAGSASAPPALAEGTANFGAMSRLMKDLEVQAFTDRFGYPPTAIRVAIDALAVFVHADNPLVKLTLPQVDAIFSSTRRCGATAQVNNWGEVGLPGSWRTRPIQRYGRNAVSGTYGYFKSQALCGGDFSNTVNEQPGAGSVIQGVSTSLNSIGYASLGLATPGVKTLSLETDEGTIVPPTLAAVANGNYPLSRYLYVYVNNPPDRPLARREREFISYILSREGQAVVQKDGHIPLSATQLRAERRKLR